jgi:hypothetical protein
MRSSCRQIKQEVSVSQVPIYKLVPIRTISKRLLPLMIVVSISLFCFCIIKHDISVSYALIDSNSKHACSFRPLWQQLRLKARLFRGVPFATPPSCSPSVLFKHQYIIIGEKVHTVAAFNPMTTVWTARVK